jgi:radical SAM protein with 4Fe4S-binding SPASM domain
MKRGLLTDETFDRILQSVKKNAAQIRVVVMYHGGEPLLHRSFVDMVKAVAALGVPQIKTVSNGMLLTADNTDAIILSGLNAIEFSLDDASEAENEKIRRRSKTEQVLLNIEHFLRRRDALNPKLNVSISSTQFINPPDIRPSDKPAVPAYALQRLGKLGIGPGDFKCTYAMRWPDMVVEPMFEIYADDDGAGDTNVCDHVESTMTIRADGVVVPCCYDLTSKLPMGNVLEQSLEEIWNSPLYLSLRKMIDEKKYPTPCDNCNVVRGKKHYLIKSAKIKNAHFNH